VLSADAELCTCNSLAIHAFQYAGNDYYLPHSFCTNSAVIFTFVLKMSFGFGVGDFLAGLQLISQIRKQFADAPSQFQAISDEYVEILPFHMILSLAL
jgi:hypothetical protein